MTDMNAGFRARPVGWRFQASVRERSGGERSHSRAERLHAASPALADRRHVPHLNTRVSCYALGPGCAIAPHPPCHRSPAPRRDGLIWCCPPLLAASRERARAAALGASTGRTDTETSAGFNPPKRARALAHRSQSEGLGTGARTLARSERPARVRAPRGERAARAGLAACKRRGGGRTSPDPSDLRRRTRARAIRARRAQARADRARATPNATAGFAR
jgi:hypothetical protein